jgi:hypothetical protein
VGVFVSTTPTLEDIAAVMDAESEKSLLELVRKIASGLGFDHFMLGWRSAAPF